MGYPGTGLLAGILAMVSCSAPRSETGFYEIADTVYVTKVIDRCNYRFLSEDPRKAKKQLQNAVRSLDQLIIEYDSIIYNRRATLKTKAAIINGSA